MAEMNRKSSAVDRPCTLPERLRLSRRFGRRLLLVFMVCAIIPAGIVALLFFRSVAS